MVQRPIQTKHLQNHNQTFINQLIHAPISFMYQKSYKSSLFLALCVFSSNFYQSLCPGVTFEEKKLFLVFTLYFLRELVTNQLSCIENGYSLTWARTLTYIITKVMFLFGKNGESTIFSMVPEFGGKIQYFFISRFFNTNVSTTPRANLVFLISTLIHEEILNQSMGLQCSWCFREGVGTVI